jgi:DNA (cytosine-5)-methyltransferase 1
MRKLTAFDIFCGLGGLSIGAEMAGLEVLGGIDANEIALKSYESIFPGRIALRADLLHENTGPILARAGIRKGDIDVLLGGPPCQAFSVYNHRRSARDPRAALFGKFLNYVTALQPKWVVVENVPGLLSIADGRLWSDLVQSLRARRYRSGFAIVNASRLGVPQLRRRLVMIGSLNSSVAEVLNAVADEHREEVPVESALGDIPVEVGEPIEYACAPTNPFQKLMRRRSGKFLQCHTGTSLGSKNLQRIAYVPPGGNWSNIPRRLLPAGMQRARKSDHTTRYGRLDRERLSFTLLTKCDPHWGCFVHPSAERVITVREAARLQSIPDYVCPQGTLSEKYRMIGNAVPPLLAKEILEKLQ